MSIFNKKPYLAAVSGGPDSIAMLHMYRHHIKVVCTVKYNKRINCEYDVECVRKICDRYHINLEVLDVDESKYNEYENIKNFQTKARLIRYDFFKSVAQKYHVKKILVAHHINDFLESAFIDFERNSKKLFYGIKKENHYDDLIILRPLINKYQKRTLIRYCQDYNLEFAIDESNELDIYERNRVRKIINSYSNDEISDLLYKTYHYNKKNKQKMKFLQKQFLHWKKINFDYDFLNSFDDEICLNLIYEFLTFSNLYRPNLLKLLSILEFIRKKSKGAYRLSDERNLRISNNKIILEKACNVDEK